MYRTFDILCFITTMLETQSVSSWTCMFKYCNHLLCSLFSKSCWVLVHFGASSQHFQVNNTTFISV
uniref:Catalase n=1 Tax=Capsicum annuum TaxID=4072 RepID=A0A1B4WGC8_CAPAN|nr:catalase [Capsicum annuum]